MKEVKYEGDLERDIKLASDDLMDKNNLINELTFISVVIVGIILGFQGINFLMFLDLLGGFIVGDLIIFGFYFNKCQLNIWNAKRRINDLTMQLENQDVLVSELNLLNKVRIRKRRLRLKKEDTSRELTVEQRIVKYWTFLDKDDQIQILKCIRYDILNSNKMEVTQKMFLLEEEDKNNLSKSLKRELKL